MAALHLEYGEKYNKEQSFIEKDIRNYIETNHQEYYDDIIVADTRFQVFFQLSVLRTGILSWYQFHPNAHVLEIGAGFGALTGLLCEKCATVTATERSAYRAEAMATRWQQKTNLDIYAGEWSEMDFLQQFDYIVLNGILERACCGSKERSAYVEYLTKLKELLKPGGILLLSVENRMGIKYFCGAGEPHTQRSFDGINGYPKGTSGYSFTHQELADIIETSGFSEHKFYYPLPDYKLPQLIYTDSYLPEQNLKERLIPYYYPKSNMVAVEADLYQDVIENEVFPFFANSFLVECGKQESFSDVVYAALSTDRGKNGGYATTIHKDNLVKKQTLHKDGQESAYKLYQNTEDLKQRGIPVVEQQWEGDELTMPFIPFPTLSNYIKEVMPADITLFERLLDKLYSYIMQSSEQVTGGKNRLAERLCDAAVTAEEKEKIQVLDWGPVLKRAYMELIPLNCFYDKSKDQFLFFDQEFVRENYPAKYILFRAIHYIYCFTPNAEKLLPQKNLIKKYGMEETREYYLQEELHFLHEVRNHQMYEQFYRWTDIDRQQIYNNSDKLRSEEERIANYTVSDKMKKIWKVELDMLEQVERICKRHDLTYFILHGTLLGAVRHKGFIPWDDDLDIGMLRKDYDAFLEAARQELQEPYFVQNMWTEKEYFIGGVTRIRNSHTTGIQQGDIGYAGNHGIWIDILPIDNCTEDDRLLKKKEKKIKHAYALLAAQIYGDQKAFLGMRPWRWRCCRLLASVYSHNALCRRLDSAVRLYSDEETRDVAIFSGYEKHRILRKADFADTILLEFEGRKLPAPIGYENYLFMTLGKDYGKYPPEAERKPNHSGIFDPEKPYTEYMAKLSGMFDDIKGRQIILFGAGMMFDDYMLKWGGRYRPAFLVDNDESKWGRKRQGIEIKAPQEIFKISEQNRRVIICSFYYKEIQKQLEEMGIFDYQIYVQNIEWIVQAEA